jgi:hypothetical protein
MPFKALLFSLFCFLISCAPTNQTTHTLKKGKVWDESKDFGYKDTVYSIPEVYARPKKGNKYVMSDLRNTYRNKACEKGSSKVVLRQVISPEGSVVGLHPIGFVPLKCASLLRETLSRHEYYPAKHKNKHVYMILAYTINDKRQK